MTISPITSSATLRVLLNGALNTGMPSAARGLQVHLVGADAEAADREHAIGGGEHRGGQLSAAADAEDVDAVQRVGQRLAVERGLHAGDVRVAGAGEHIHRGVVNAFEQQDADEVLGKRRGDRCATRGSLGYDGRG